MAHLLLPIILGLCLCLQGTSASSRVPKRSLLLSLRPSDTLEQDSGYQSGEDSLETFQEATPLHASLETTQINHKPLKLSLESDITQQKSQQYVRSRRAAKRGGRSQGRLQTGVSEQERSQVSRRAIRQLLRATRVKREVETSLTVRDDITKVVTVNPNPGMRQRLQCGRFCEFGECNILHIPGLFERRYCTCLPNYTGLQCHIRVVPEN